MRTKPPFPEQAYIDSGQAISRSMARRLKVMGVPVKSATSKEPSQESMEKAREIHEAMLPRDVTCLNDSCLRCLMTAQALDEAVAQERERCAKVAENFPIKRIFAEAGSLAEAGRRLIAEAIREV